jgi:hypothetical protein
MTRDEMIDDLLGKEEIRQAMARYARGIDRLDEATVKAVYHEDSHDDHGWGLTGSGWDLATLCNREAGTGFPEEWTKTTHFLGQHLIEVTGDRAASEVYFMSYSLYDDPDGVEWAMIACGRYVDRWERRDGTFRISHRTVLYDWSRTEAHATPWPGPDHNVPKFYHGGPANDPATATFGVFGRGDPSYSLLEAALHGR